MNSLKVSFIAALFFMACQSQEKIIKKSFNCNGKKIEVTLSEIIEDKSQSFTEGNVQLFQTKDSVFIEFYCGGNYSPVVSNKTKFKVLSSNENTKTGVDTNGLYWRKDGKLSYFNCQAKDTAKYNKIFDSKIIATID